MKRNKKKMSLIDKYKKLKDDYAGMPFDWAISIAESQTNPLLKAISLWLEVLGMLLTMTLVGLWLLPAFILAIIPLFLIAYLFGVVGEIIDLFIIFTFMLYKLNKAWDERERQIDNYLGGR